MTAFPSSSFSPRSSPSPSRRRLLSAGGALLGATLLPGVARAADAWQDVVLPQARQRDLVSSITGGRYRIFISVPDTPVPAAVHPVLYALDGNASFPLLAQMARTAARRTKATGQAAPVVVGIGYPTGDDYHPDRGRDYTPPTPGAPATEGGAGRFLDFIEQELKPLVRTLAPIDPQRQALYGHSYGGLCTLHALFTRPAMFQTYLAASPSIWYRGRAVLAGLEGFDKRVATLAVKPSVLLCAGELEQPAAGGAPGSRDAIAAERRMIDEARALSARLGAMSGTVARAEFMLFPRENHGSAAFPAMARGMEFFLA
ncbi:alpha/beta hydrolase-fold protein [Pseudoduganella sp. SL102]|uniref:alpha/beta hydrolase n=1 Tax=Pseudoduganella sp. SL102 TaxID=2995154 RepID=UPI00248CBEDF|nr:alpha/beta hydrolase-fold protein [Pseudoduganella sp. SL102]WBS03950.1 alpha/beta hydrolase-fold protein [Pseudoduganella sp. SL102]